ADALVAALEKTDATLLVTYPNADTAGVTVIERLEEFAGRCARVRLVRNLGDDLYLSVLAAADAMVGNSSSGLIEAPSFALPVVNTTGQLVGLATDGDLRKAILRGVSLEAPVEQAMNRTPLVAERSLAPGAALALMRRRSIRQLPVVDAERRVVDLLFLDDLVA